MSSDAATTIGALEPGNSVHRMSSVHHIVRRPSATFLVLEPISGEVPEPGAYSGEVELAGVQAPCAITVLDDERGRELWCQPRGPLARSSEDEVTLRFCLSGRTGRR